MKKFFIMLTAVIALSACSKEDQGGKDITLAGGTQTTQTVYADETSKTDGIKFNATAPWTATVSEVAVNRAGGSDVDWLFLNAYSGGVGEQSLTLTLLPNTTGSDRKAEIRIVCGGTSITIIVEQKATTQSGDKPEPQPTSYFITSDGKITGGEIFGDKLPSELSWMIARMDEGDAVDVISPNKVPYTNKNFSMALPAPDANVLGTLHSSEATIKPNILPGDAQFAGGAVGYKMENAQMSLELTNISLENLRQGEEYLVKKGEGYVTFIYATKASTVNGTLKYHGDPQTFKFSNCKFRQGWNEIVMIAESNADVGGVVTINVTTNNATSDFKWVAVGYEETGGNYDGYLVTSITLHDDDSSVTNFIYNKEHKISSINKYSDTYNYTHFSDRIVMTEKQNETTLKLSDAGRIVSADSPTMQRRFTYTNDLQLAKETHTPINGGEGTLDYTIYDWQTAGKVTTVTFLSDIEYTTSVYELSTQNFHNLSNLNLFSLLTEAGYNPISMLEPYYGKLGESILISKVTTTGDKWNKDNGVLEFRYELTPDNTRITKIYETWTPAGGSRSSEYLRYTITYDR